jgi:hypothetical protein
MALWTKLQRKYVKDIEDNLGITFNGRPTRVDADKFIKENSQANYEAKISKGKKQFPPTGKQLRYIEDIEKSLDIKFRGRTIKSAAKFIKQYKDEYETVKPAEHKMKLYYNAVADKIEKNQRRKSK